MRWLTFTILALITLTLQGSVAFRFEMLGLRPDWILAVVVLVALYARPQDTVIGAWVLGLAADLMTLERLGFMALTYALVAWLVVAVRPFLFGYRATTQFLVTVGAALLVQTVWGVYRLCVYPDPAWSAGSVWVEISLGALYTGLWAPLIGKLLLRCARLLGFARPRYSYGGLHRLRGLGV